MPSGEAPASIEDLKAAIWHAQPGSGQVQRAITNATFKLGIRGFTSLLQGVSRERNARAWEKALEIRSVMEKRSDLRGNVYTYSVRSCHHARGCSAQAFDDSASGQSH